MDFKLLFISELLFGCLTAIVARSRGRSPWIWFIMGMLLTWIGLIILLLLPASVAQTTDEVPLVPEFLGAKNIWEGTSDWFYIDQEKKIQGPVSIKILYDLWNEKKLFSDTWVWHEKIEDWKTIHDVKSLLDVLESKK